MTATISIMTMGQQWRCLMSLKKQPVRTKNSFLIRSILLLVRSMYKMPELPTPLCKQYFLSALEYFHNIITSLHNYSYSLQWWVRYVVQSGTLNCYAATSSRLYHADTPFFMLIIGQNSMAHKFWGCQLLLLWHEYVYLLLTHFAELQVLLTCICFLIPTRCQS